MGRSQLIEYSIISLGLCERERAKEQLAVGRGWGSRNQTVPGYSSGYRDARKPSRIPIRACDEPAARNQVGAFSGRGTAGIKKPSPQDHPTSSWQPVGTAQS
ncbi:MAG: hypothetical protein COV85_04230 [Candidatus Portnoybacteria bacterium CG11_big_fil_rev_8_21_14_0_20_44_10]|uniref:Uncharacterized protein n=1 Tax=Candidatus Portnoybacteria bacterium CG11_big_fil_rev_8_21_14_0_20_44_10 TaxID=1974818 RepID=A0A2H0KPH4_9BACT|nr:MAG: hypothetical protein COV85_04230 [Candidatus Portnoybacteria bacterium CG11_big_fil_rev_8_21_14_0_20_44_10]